MTEFFLKRTHFSPPFSPPFSPQSHTSPTSPLPSVPHPHLFPPPSFLLRTGLNVSSDVLKIYVVSRRWRDETGRRHAQKKVLGDMWVLFMTRVYVWIEGRVSWRLRDHPC